MLFLDGVYEVDSEGGTGKFHVIETPNTSEMQRWLHRISKRIARLLEREGYLNGIRKKGVCCTHAYRDLIQLDHI